MAEDRDLLQRTLRGGIGFLLTLAFILFVSAWTLAWWQAWLYLAVFTVCCTAITAYFLKHDPALIARRLEAGPGAEKERSQQIIQSVASVALISTYIVAGLDRRFGWTHTPVAITLISEVLVALGFWVVFRVFQENSFTSSVIEVDAGQKVVSTGPYAWVRHPMYAGAFLLLLATPLALGGLWALIPALALVAVITWRALDEEQFLSRNLPGYRDYQATVRHRLIPYIW